MGLILGDKVPYLMKGKPTISDKYDVSPATIASTSAVGHPGDIVKFDGKGFFEVVDSTHTITKATDVAGIILAPNVKLVNDFFGGVKAEAVYQTGEAFDLCFKGAIALELDSAVELTAVKQNGTCYLTSAGKLTTTSASNIAMPWTFTGVTETDMAGRKLAEVIICK